VLEAARRLRDAGRAFAVALVVATEGSTYRKPGALALVADDGSQVGVVSGGCLEPGLVELAGQVIAAGEPRDTTFDTRSDDDQLFGSGSGCRGRMRVLVLPVRPEASSAAFDALATLLDSRRPVRLDLDRLAANLRPCGQLTLRPPPLVVLVGAGPEAPPLLGILRTLGWFAWLADHRPAPLGARSREADRIIEGRPAAAIAALGDASPEAVLVMTHTAEHDLAALRALATHATPYVGLLGPPARRDELLAELTFAERAALAGRLHAPVGLPLGGEGPEAIALAIAADLQRAFHG
jgi:xanthine dehydrogenase accessory factor